MRINKEIRAPKVRLIDKDGKQVGVVDLLQALLKAKQDGLDLIEVAPNSTPPVCKIIDYGKYRYQVTKKKRDNKKAQHQIKIKEIKVKVNIGDNDLQVKINRAKDFIDKGNKVRITCVFRNRELSKQNLGKDVLDRIIDQLKDVAHLESGPKLMGRNLSLLLVSLNKKKQ